MTEEEQRVREQVAEELYLQQFLDSYRDRATRWDTRSKQYKQIFLKDADQILAIKGIRIAEDDQSLPAVPERFKIKAGLTSVYDEGWRNGYKCLKGKLAGFVRVIPYHKER